MENEVIGTYFKSYIVYDLETTTLPCFGQPKITEISVIAVVRDHIEKHDNKEELPRVMNKLTLCVYPQKRIPLDTERITGLSNPLLEEQTPFNDNMFIILSEFIARMPKPACLIAHNGIRFDFPILQAEIHKLGKKFPDDLWCADSLPAFRYLYSEKPDPQQLVISCQENKPLKIFSSDLESMFSDTEEFDPVLCDVLDSIEQTVLSKTKKHGGVSNLDKDKARVLCSFETSFGDALTESVDTLSLLSTPSSIKKMQKINETTPKRPSHKSNKKSPANFARYENTCTPDPSAHYLKCKRIRKTGPVKRLTDEFNGINGPKSFKLVDIYQYLCKKDPMNAHTAEADSTMLLHSIIASRVSFLDWVDKNATLFNGVQKMW